MFNASESSLCSLSSSRSHIVVSPMPPSLMEDQTNPLRKFGISPGLIEDKTLDLKIEKGETVFRGISVAAGLTRSEMVGGEAYCLQCIVVDEAPCIFHCIRQGRCATGHTKPGAGGTPSYGLYRYVRPQGVGFFTFLSCLYPRLLAASPIVFAAFAAFAALTCDQNSLFFFRDGKERR